ncbi:MAG TPA: patatin-like phospholipase family protein [Candidatus Acidoferrales bacterium]|jgi:NTE family protein|nr:patatin-like phospholipase family protein [Candidatus Acidoferrales bacterium]
MTTLRRSEPSVIPQSTNAPRTRGIPDAGKAPGIALALGGGFSRGFAHLGVLEVLEQGQLPISTIVGTSIGGLLGSAYADGISVRDLCDLGRRVRLRDFLRFQTSDDGAQRQKKDCIGQFIQEWFRARSLEELPIPTAIVATDLGNGAPYVFTNGPLEVAIRASCAFPGLVKPVEYEGRLLADGCMVAPVPTAIAARIHSGCVLGVSVGSNTASASSSENVVKVFDPGFRASHRIGLEPSWSRHADILLEPQVHHIDWNDFSRVDDAFAAGVEAMRRALPSLRELLDRQSQLASVPSMSVRAERGLAL